jgi:hypothetical protein
MSHQTRRIAALECLEQLDDPKPALREFMVPYAIEGAMPIWAPDAEMAKFIVDHHTSLSEFVENGRLETFDAEPVQ